MLFLSLNKPVKVGRDQISCSSPAEQSSELSSYIWLGAQQKNDRSSRLWAYLAVVFERCVE